MEANNDFDLAALKLDETTMSLNIVDASSNAAGLTETIDLIVEPGIYYFWVDGYSGTGIFELTAYTSTYDLDYEINDYISIASSVNNNNFTAKGVIDNPIDYDYYKFNITGTRITNFNFTKPSGKNYVMYLILNGTNVYEVQNGTNYDIPEGTHYIVVYSTDGLYDNNSPYTVKVSSETYIPGLATYVSTADGANNFQLDDSGDYYVNRNYINFNWDYTSKVNNFGYRSYIARRVSTQYYYETKQ